MQEDKINEIVGSNSYGTLIDQDIITLSRQGVLISAHFEPENVKHCCYELRASTTYYILNENLIDSKTKHETENYIVIKPKSSIVIMTKEKLNIPKNIIGRVILKGSLFSMGIIPVNTYADPGFQGTLGIVFTNSSLNYLKVNPGESIAKIEFSKLTKEVSQGYNGQHGYNSGFWPVRHEMIMTNEEIKDVSDQNKVSGYDKIQSIVGLEIANKLEFLDIYLRKILILSLVIIILNLILILFVNSFDISHISSIFLGILTNIIWIALEYLLNKKRKEK